MVVSVDVGVYLQPETVSPKVFKFLKKISEGLSPQERTVILTFNEYPFSYFARMSPGGYSNGEKLPTHVVVPCIRFVYDRTFHFLGSLFLYSNYLESNRTKFSKDISECIKLYIIALHKANLHVLATVSPYTDIFSQAIQILSHIPYMDQHYGAISYDVGNIFNIIHIHDPTHAEQSLISLIFKNDFHFMYELKEHKASESDIMDCLRLDNKPLLARNTEANSFEQIDSIGQYYFSTEVCVIIARLCKTGMLPAEAIGTSIFIEMCILLYRELYSNTDKAKYLINNQTAINTLIQFVQSVNIIERKKPSGKSSKGSNSKRVDPTKSTTVRNLKDIDSHINKPKSHERDGGESTGNKEKTTKLINSLNYVISNNPVFLEDEASTIISTESGKTSDSPAGSKKNKKKKQLSISSEILKEIEKAKNRVAIAQALQSSTQTNHKSIVTPTCESKDNRSPSTPTEPSSNQITPSSKTRIKKQKKMDNQSTISKVEASVTSTPTRRKGGMDETAPTCKKNDDKSPVPAKERFQMSTDDITPNSKTKSKKQKKDSHNQLEPIPQSESKFIAEAQNIQTKNSEICEQQVENSKSAKNIEVMQKKSDENKHNPKHIQNDDSTNSRKSKNKRGKRTESLNTNQTITENAVPKDEKEQQNISGELKRNEDTNEELISDQNSELRKTTKLESKVEKGIGMKYNEDNVNKPNSLESLKANGENYKKGTSSNENSKDDTMRLESSIQQQEIDMSEIKRCRTPVDLEISEVLIMLSGQAMTENKFMKKDETEKIPETESSAKKTICDAFEDPLVDAAKTVESRVPVKTRAEENKMNVYERPKLEGEGQSFVSLKDLKSALSKMKITDVVKTFTKKVKVGETSISLENLKSALSKTKITDEIKTSKKIVKEGEYIISLEDLESASSKIPTIDNIKAAIKEGEYNDKTDSEPIPKPNADINRNEENDVSGMNQKSEPTISEIFKIIDEVGDEDETEMLIHEQEDLIAYFESVFAEKEGMDDISEASGGEKDNETNEIPHLVDDPETTVLDTDIMVKTEASAAKDNNEPDEIPDSRDSEFKESEIIELERNKASGETDEISDSVDASEQALSDTEVMIKSEAFTTKHNEPDEISDLVQDTGPNEIEIEVMDNSIDSAAKSDNGPDEIPDLIYDSESTFSDTELMIETKDSKDDHEIPDLVEDSESNASENAFMDKGEGCTDDILRRTKDYAPVLEGNSKSTHSDSILKTADAVRTGNKNIEEGDPKFFNDDSNIDLYEEIVGQDEDEVFFSFEEGDVSDENISSCASNTKITENDKLTYSESEKIESEFLISDSSQNHFKIRSAKVKDCTYLRIEDTIPEAEVSGKTKQPKEVRVSKKEIQRKPLSPMKPSDIISPTSEANKKTKSRLDKRSTFLRYDGSDKENSDGNQEMSLNTEMIPILEKFAEKFANDQVDIDTIKDITKSISSVAEKYVPTDVISEGSMDLLVRNYLTPDEYKQILGSEAEIKTFSQIDAMAESVKNSNDNNSKKLKSSKNEENNDSHKKESSETKGLIKISWKDSKTVSFENVKTDSVKQHTKDPFKITDLRVIESKAMGENATNIAKSICEDVKNGVVWDYSTNTDNFQNMPDDFEFEVTEQVKDFIDSFNKNEKSGSENSPNENPSSQSDSQQGQGAIKKTLERKPKNSTDDIDDLKTWVNFKQFSNMLASFLKMMSRSYALPFSGVEILEKIEENCIEFFITRRSRKCRDSVDDAEAGAAYANLFYMLLGKTVYKLPHVREDLGSIIEELDSLATADREDEDGKNMMKPDNMIVRNLWIHNTIGIRTLFLRLHSQDVYDELSPDLFKTDHVFNVMKHILQSGNDPFSFNVDNDCLPLDIRECFDNLKPHGSVLLVE